MAEESVRIRLRLGGNEIEIEAPPALFPDALAKAEALLGRLQGVSPVQVQRDEGSERPQSVGDIPEVKVDKGDSLADIIRKFFQHSWGRQPRKLSDVRSALESYGLVYPKQSVAVALLRLAQAGKLRRFKGEGAEFVYVVSPALLGEPPAIHAVEEASH